MQIGDLVMYRGWKKHAGLGTSSCPMGVVIDQMAIDSEFHHRIRVMWIGETIPVQARVLSITGDRVTTWVKPNQFEVINEVGS
mgnify:CR=1 FL=1